MPPQWEPVPPQVRKKARQPSHGPRCRSYFAVVVNHHRRCRVCDIGTRCWPVWLSLARQLSAGVVSGPARRSARNLETEGLAIACFFPSSPCRVQRCFACSTTTTCWLSMPTSMPRVSSSRPCWRASLRVGARIVAHAGQSQRSAYGLRTHRLQMGASQQLQETKPLAHKPHTLPSQ